MRTVAIEDDVAARVEEEARRAGVSVDEMVNRKLRSGLDQGADAGSGVKPFVVRSKRFGLPKEWTSGSVSELIEMLEGPLHK